ncbi:MAG: nuclear transport factor 2 family protein [Myxococcota bacterium]|nr:nuclear transport factor 2 family protein [Myxococcota bacterium]
MKTLPRTITTLCLVTLFGCAHTPQQEAQNPVAANAAALVNRYLTIMMVERKQGAGLVDILDSGFVFEDPFVGRSDSVHQFIDNPQVQRWIDTPKSLRMQRQFVDGRHVCSTFAIDVVGPSGAAASYDVVDVVEVRGDRIVKEAVYFANPLKFAKDMGFAAAYVKPFGSKPRRARAFSSRSATCSRTSGIGECSLANPEARSDAPPRKGLDTPDARTRLSLASADQDDFACCSSAGSLASTAEAFLFANSSMRAQPGYLPMDRVPR